MYPDQSLYPANSVPQVVKRINNTLLRADQLNHAEGNDSVDWLQPIIADAEAGFGGVLNAFELMKSMIEAGAAGVHFEDQLASVKKCGHMGGKVLVPTREAVEKLCAARLAAVFAALADARRLDDDLAEVLDQLERADRAGAHDHHRALAHGVLAPLDGGDRLPHAASCGVSGRRVVPQEARGEHGGDEGKVVDFRL